MALLLKIIIEKGGGIKNLHSFIPKLQINLTLVLSSW